LEARVLLLSGLNVTRELGLFGTVKVSNNIDFAPAGSNDYYHFWEVIELCRE